MTILLRKHYMRLLFVTIARLTLHLERVMARQAEAKGVGLD